MGESLQEYLVGLIRQEGRRSVGARLILAVLTVLSWVYGLAILIRNQLYDLGLAHAVKLPCLVVSVGNITTGGTGKTPLVEYLARLLQGDGRKVCILSRGYRSELRSKTAIGIVSDESGVRLTAKVAGDEAYLLAKALPGVPVVIGKARSLAGKAACENLGCEVAVLDDGYQHRRLYREIDVVAVDAINPFGNGCLLPRGFLRERRQDLRRADVIVLTRTDQVPDAKLEELQREVRRWNQAAPIFLTVHGPTAWECLTSERHEGKTNFLPLDKLAGRPVVAVSGIGNPGSFERTLRDAGVEVRDHLRFSDHHDYEPADVEAIINSAHARQVHIVVTTQKDAVKLGEKDIESLRRAGLELYVLRISLQPKDANEFREFFRREVSRHVKAKSGEAGY